MSFSPSMSQSSVLTGSGAASNSLRSSDTTSFYKRTAHRSSHVRKPTISAEVLMMHPQISQRYTFIQNLSSGASSEVYIVFDFMKSVYYAAKISSMSQASPPSEASESGSSQGSVHQTSDTWGSRKSAAENKNVAIYQDEDLQPYMAACIDKFFVQGHIILILELACNGDLQCFIDDRFSSDSTQAVLPEDLVKDIMSHVACCLSKLHATGIVHRDLKPANIVFSHDMRPKLVDFDLSRGAIHALCADSLSPSSKELHPCVADQPAFPGLPKVLAGFPSPVVVGRPDGNIAYVNSCAVLEFGFSSWRELVGKPLTMLMKKDFHQVHQKFIDSYIRHRKASLINCPRTLPVVLQDGSIVFYQVALSELDNSAYVPGAGITFCAIFFPVSKANVEPKLPQDTDEHDTPSRKSQTVESSSFPLSSMATRHGSGRVLIGTPMYMSPEIITGRSHGPPTDWWSFGIILYQLLSGDLPFKGDGTIAGIHASILSGSYVSPSYWSAEATNLVKNLLVPDPARRLSFDLIMKHPFFKQVDWHSCLLLNRKPSTPACDTSCCIQVSQIFEASAAHKNQIKVPELQRSYTEDEPSQFESFKPHESILGSRWHMNSRIIGAGGSGVVYLGGSGDHTKVAIKRITCGPENTARVRHFLHHLKGFFHPNCVHILDVVEKDGAFNIVMELMHESLYQVMKREGPLPEAQVVSIIKQVLHGLGYLHCLNVVHRDVKPGNIMVGSNGVWKLGDFGSAFFAPNAGCDRPLGGSTVVNDINAKHMRMSEQGIVSKGTTDVGTFVYMPPEALKDGSDITDIRLLKARDIWSIGATAYHALTGNLPFCHERKVDTPLRFLNEMQRQNNLVHIPEDCSPPFAEFLRACLNPEPLQRPESFELIFSPVFENSD